KRRCNAVPSTGSSRGGRTIRPEARSGHLTRPRPPLASRPLTKGPAWTQKWKGEVYADLGNNLPGHLSDCRRARIHWDRGRRGDCVLAAPLEHRGDSLRRI